MAVLVGAGALAGCGSGSSSSSSASSAASSEEAAASASSAEETADAASSAEEGSDTEVSDDTSDTASSGDEIVLNFPSIWVGEDSKASGWKEIVDSFNEEYDGQYQVDIEEQTDYDLYRDKIRTQVSAGDVPDLFTTDSYSDVQLFSQTGDLLDLTEFLSQDEISSRFIPGTIDAAQVDGVSYAMPYENAIIPILFNQRLLTAAGVDEIPTSWEELWDAAEKLQASGVAPIVESTKDNAWFAQLWYSYAVAAAGGPDVYDNGLDDPAFVEAAELLQKEFQYTHDDAIGADATVVNGHFFNERAAIYVNGSWILGRIKSEGVEGLYDNLVVSPGLSLNGENGGGYLSTTQAYILAAKQDDPAKEAAVTTFLDYVTDPDRVLALTQSSGSLFAISVDSDQIDDPVLASIIEQSANASFTINTFAGAESAAVVAEFPAAVESLALGDITPEEFVEELQAAE